MTAGSVKVHLTPVVRFVRSLDGEYYLLSEVAAALDVPVPTLRRLKTKNSKLWGPSFKTHYGKTLIYLYTPADLARLARRFAKIRAEHPAMLTGSLGRPRMWNLAERQERQRRFAQAGYMRKRAQRLRVIDPVAAKEANRCSRLMIKQLRNEARVRRAELATRM